MEFIVWLVFSMAFATALLNVFVITGWFQDRFGWMGEPANDPDKPVQDFTEWQKIVAEGKRYKIQQHKDWLEEAWAILRRDCEHVYHHQKWYTCMKCGYEEPWKWEPNCGCTVSSDGAISDKERHYSLITRQSFCTVHGTDFKLFPLSDRKKGPYGPTGDSAKAVERSRELFGHYVKKIQFPTE